MLTFGVPEGDVNVAVAGPRAVEPLDPGLALPCLFMQVGHIDRQSTDKTVNISICHCLTSNDLTAPVRHIASSALPEAGHLQSEAKNSVRASLVGT